MNLHNISVNHITAWLVIPLGLALAVWAGNAVAGGQTIILLGIMGGVLGLTLVLATGRSIWLMIPLCWPLTGSISLLPLPFSIRELAVMGAFGVYCAHVAMKHFRGVKRSFDYLDFFIGLNLALIMFMYLRNPIGVAALGSETVGGRPYLAVAISFMAFLVLSRIVVQPRLAFWFPAVMLGPNFIVSALNVLTYVFPQWAPLIAPFYSGIDVHSYMQEEYGRGAGPVTLQEGRFQGLAVLGLPILTALLCYYSPTKILGFFARPALFLLMLFAIFCVGMAGFRNVMFQAGFYLLLAAYLWERGIGVFRIALICFVCVVLAISVQSVTSLPESIQRSLSFIPGPWDDRVKDGSKQSTDWRVEMWQVALTTDRYIQNKVLGDGFGFTAKELEIMRSASFGGVGFLDGEAHKESFMIQGSFHSGPVSSIRFAGYIGLAAIILLLVAIAFYAVKMMRLAWATEYRPLAIFLTLGAVYAPIFFILVFGEYRNDLPNALFTAGMLKMLHNSLRANKQSIESDNTRDELPSTRSTPLSPQADLADVRIAK